MNGRRDLAGRVALVTGSARNIGRAIALELAGAGAAIMVNARTSDTDAEAVCNEIRQVGGRSAFKTWRRWRSRRGRRARPGDHRVVRSHRHPDQQRECSARNRFRGPRLSGVAGNLVDDARCGVLCSHAALPHLIQSGSGAIINIGGLSAHTGAARRAHVIAAKAGLVGLTRALAHDLAPHGITVNCVAPGLIDTRRASTGQPAHHALHAPLAGRLGKPEEIGALVRFLCGPDARYITGQTIHANGGVYCS